MLKNKLLAGLACAACVFTACGVWAQDGFSVANAETSGGDKPSVKQGVGGDSSTSLHSAQNDIGEGESGEIATPDRLAMTDTGENGVAIEIVAKNLSYSDSIYILYAVDFDGFDESQNEVKMLFWNSAQDEYTVETAESVKSAEYFTTVGEKECIVFYSDGIAARKMNDTVYCRAYASVDGVAVYSDVMKYSVVDYVYEMREKELTEEQTNVFADMLDYGSSAQKLFGYNADKLANATYYTIFVENGMLEDGFSWGRYALNAEATLTANAPADGYEFLSWTDETGVTVAETATVSVAVTANNTYTAVYGEISNAMPASAFEYSIVNNESVTITKYIGDYTDVIIPSKIEGLPVTSIGNSAFNSCISLTSVVIPDSVTSIGAWAFYKCTSLTNIAIPNDVTSIGNSAFSNCSNLMSVVIGDSVTSIGNSVFYYCTNLTSITIPDSVTSIGESAFAFCTRLTSIAILGSVTSIGDSTFYLCSLTSITIPDSVTLIGDSAFYFCKLTSITIPNGVTSIGSSAFSKCSRLTSLVIPDSVTSIGSSAFYNCSSLTDIYITDIGAWCGISGLGSLMGEGASEKKLYLNNELVTELVIPDGVASIGASAFTRCSGLTSVVIGDSVTSIGKSAFGGCSGLTSVVIPDSATSIGEAAFSACSGLTCVVIPDSVTSIGRYAFENCSKLTSVVIPNSVTSIEYQAFYGCGGR